jgi:hypothetical protein
VPTRASTRISTQAETSSSCWRIIASDVSQHACSFPPSGRHPSS